MLYAALSLFLFIAVFIPTELEVSIYLYLAGKSFFPLCGSFVDVKECLLENIMFLLNSMAYAIGYMVYMRNIREDMIRCINGLSKDKSSPTPSVSSGSSMSSPRDIESASFV